MCKHNFKSFTLTQMEEFLKEMGEPAYRAKQIFRWIYKGQTEFDAMTNLPKSLIEKLKNCAYISTVKIRKKRISTLDDTIKYVFSLEDGNTIESVKMKYSFGTTACISSQVGCAMGCTFCASTEAGMERNLYWWEMADQVLAMEKDLKEKINRVVIMGSGEPLLNYDEVLNFIKVINSPRTFNIGFRKITLSTCGIIPGIIRLAKEGIPVTLAVSLHAPNDTIRSNIMPINERYPILQLLDACKYYIMETKRRVTFEYALISNINDTKKCAEELSDLLEDILCHVNLIPLNTIKETKYRSSQLPRIQKFKEILSGKGISTTIRRELGSDIEAACGQLRRGLMMR